MRKEEGEGGGAGDGTVQGRRVKPRTSGGGGARGGEWRDVSAIGQSRGGART